MSVQSTQTPVQTSLEDDTYLRLLQAEQDHTKTRWTVATFFMSISFAILGFSFQDKLAANAPFILRISGLLIYWFAFLLFLRFHTYSKLLGNYLWKMEEDKRTSLNIQHKDKEARESKSIKKIMYHISSTWLLFGFGLLYIIGVIFLQVFGW